jgi:hypothetical protein
MQFLYFFSSLDPVPLPSKPAQDDPFADFLLSDSTSNTSSGWPAVNNGTTQVAASVSSDAFGFSSAAGAGSQSKTSTKDAIMALYGSSVPGTANQFGVPAGGERRSRMFEVS